MPVHVAGDGQFGPGEAGGGDVLEQERGVIACSGAQDLGVADDEGGGETAVKGFNLVLAVGRVVTAAHMGP